MVLQKTTHEEWVNQKNIYKWRRTDSGTGSGQKTAVTEQGKAQVWVLCPTIKTLYAIFEPLMDKGLPYFWDNENRLLKKDHYDNLIIAKRNDHSSFEDLEGNLRGEVLVANLGDVFELLNMIKNTIFPQMEVEEYINLEILSIQMKDLMLPTKNHFKELIKMVVKPLGLIPLTS